MPAKTIEPKVQLYQKILAAQKAIDAIDKDGQNKAQGYGYASAGNVCTQTRKALHDNGLIILPSMVDCTEQLIERQKTDPNTGEITISRSVLAKVKTEYRIIDTETAEFETVTFFGYGYDPTDKAGNKAITAAGKSALLQILQLATGDGSDDGNGGGGDTTRESKPFPSKYGSEDKPDKCKFCGERHIVKGTQMIYVGEVCGAQACKDKIGKPNAGGSNGDGIATQNHIDSLERMASTWRDGHLDQWWTDIKKHYLKNLKASVAVEILNWCAKADPADDFPMQKFNDMIAGQPASNAADDELPF